MPTANSYRPIGPEAREAKVLIVHLLGGDRIRVLAALEYDPSDQAREPLRVFRMPWRTHFIAEDLRDMFSRDLLEAPFVKIVLVPASARV